MRSAPIESAALPPGLVPLSGGSWHASVWAPRAAEVSLHILSPDRVVPLERGADGVHRAVLGARDGMAAGTRYRFRLTGADAGAGADMELADPASRHQPDGVMGPSAAFDPSFAWTDAGYRPPPLESMVIYELHIGTFTAAGTFDAAIARLDRLIDLGVNAIEIMPVSEFPGGRNWGYDGVFPWAVQSTYGGPAGLMRLVDACHQRGLAALLDVVYNHLGPEGNWLPSFGPYLSDRHRTWWGSALNFDGPDSDEVRRYFVESARYFARDLHLDGFRLDAVHAIVDTSARPFLVELSSSLQELGAELGRPILTMAESDLNDARLVAPWERGGMGMDAQWADDFHHAVHTLLTGEASGYYADYGSLRHLARVLSSGWAYSGDYSRVRRRRHGNPTGSAPGRSFVVFTQNHDQIGNRARGDRLSETVSPAEDRLAAALLCCAPFVPLLFMGQEVGERAPFQYFTSHEDPGLIEAVRRGRIAEFAAFGWRAEDVPDPHDPATFARSKVSEEIAAGAAAGMFELYRELLRLRRELPALRRLDRERVDVSCLEHEGLLMLLRWTEDGPARAHQQVLLVASFAREQREVGVPIGRWRVALDTADPRWTGVATAGAVTPADDRWIEGERGRVRVAARSAVLLVCDGASEA
ncbi:MAG TPA: malto-oligosyltrehalose trehalohydrolase [Kofleriaceae bacterium]|nr:malto-oligosyltrehalose trehalohydrolase [Kofleriaceae bacterium]